jgi:gluconate 2-dehydrogenase gamma chain
MRFLTDDQAATLAAVADRIFPSDARSPGANDLGVVDYIDGQLAGPWGQGDKLFRDGPFRRPEDVGHGWQSPLTPAQVYSRGLEELDRLAQASHGTRFHMLGPSAQEDIMHACEQDAVDGDFGENVSAATFFKLLHQNVIEGLFADPRHGGNRGYGGWRWLGLPEGVG